MNLKIARAAPLAALLLLGAAPPNAVAGTPAKEPGRQCFWTSQVSGYNTLDDKTVLVRVGVKDVYRLGLMGPCPDVDWSQSIALVSRGSSMICSGLDAEVITPSSIGPRKCAVRSVAKLTPEEAAAAQGKHRR